MVTVRFIGDRPENSRYKVYLGDGDNMIRFAVPSPYDDASEYQLYFGGVNVTNGYDYSGVRQIRASIEARRPGGEIVYESDPMLIEVYDRVIAGQLSEGKPYQQYVTDADGKAKWEERLAYKDAVETIVLPEMTGVVSEDSNYGERQLDNISVENLTGSIAVGDMILVKWNDETYECGVKAYDMGFYYFGVLDDYANGDYPFRIVGKDGTNFAIYVSDTQAAGTEIVVSMTKNENIVKQIPAEYLPEGVGGGVTYYSGENNHLYHDAACSLEVTYDEGVAAMFGGVIRVTNEARTTIWLPTAIWNTGTGIQLSYADTVWFIGNESTGEG